MLEGYAPKAISRRIQAGLFITGKMTAGIIGALKRHTNYAEVAGNIATYKMMCIPKISYADRHSYVGQLSHPILENLLFESLWRRGVESYHERYCNLPESRHKIDSWIEMASQPSLYSILSSEILRDLRLDIETFEECFIDYTLSSKSVMEKVGTKPYLTGGRVLFIVIYGPHDKESINQIKERVKDSNFPLKENARVLSVLEFAKLFKIDGEFLTKLEYLNDLIQTAVEQDKGELEELETLADEALENLEDRYYHC